MTLKNKTYRNVILTTTITSILAVIMITSGFGVAYADGIFPGKNEFGDTFGAGKVDAFGANSAAFGQYTNSSGSTSAAFGFDTQASGIHSATFGVGTTAQTYVEFVIGRYNEIFDTSDSWVLTDPLFVIGNGNNLNNPNTAVTVLKNGNVGIGTSSPNSLLEIGDPSSGTTLTLGRLTGNPSISANSGGSGGWLIMDSTGTGNVGLNYYDDGKVILANGGGNVGIGTTTPNSELEVVGYIQLDTISGTPPSGDCTSADIGRMKMDSANNNLYVCSTNGWQTK